MTQKIQYLNTDLDLAARFDLAPLAHAFSTRGVHALHVSEAESGNWTATFEVDDPDIGSDPENTISALLTAIDSLDARSAQSWAACTQREFNIGYECGDEPRNFNHELTSSIISKMAGFKISLRITIYPPAATLPHLYKKPTFLE